MSILLCFVLPSIISLKIEKDLLKNEYKMTDIVLNYFIYCLFNNVITITIMYFLFNISNNIEYSIKLYPGITVKYALISIFIAIVLSLIKLVFTKNIEVNLERKNKKNN